MDRDIVTKPPQNESLRTSSALTALQPHELDRAEVVVEILREHIVVYEALKRLSKELPPDLAYHNLQHTNDVLHQTVALAVRDGLNQDDIVLLVIAAAWHDTGFIRQREKNEAIAAAWAREAMERRGGFTPDEIRDVETAILDTQIKYDVDRKILYQNCTGRLSPWLLDGDLVNFGSKEVIK